MAKKKKIVGIIGLNGEIQKIKDEDSKDNKKNANTKLNIVGSVDSDGNITKYNDSENKTSGISNSRSRMKESHLQRYNLDGTPKIPIADSITNKNIITLGEKNKLTNSFQNSISQKIVNGNQQATPKIDLSGKSYLQDTGKTYGDYYYDNYSQNKDKKIYVNTKDGNYFLDNNGKYEKLGTGLTSNINTMTTKSAEDKKIKEAKKQGYKGNQSSQKLEKYLNEVSKKTGFTNEELYTIASDYENGKWKPASSKYAEISSRLNKAGYQGYEVANKINKLKKESTQDINTTITNEVYPQEQIPWYKKIIKGSEAFNDGYDVGDITKTVVATAQDIGANIGEGFLGTVEGISDTLQYGSADLMDLFKKKAAAKAIRENAKFNSTAAIFGKNEKEEDNFVKGWTEKVDKNSIAGQGLDSISQGVGNIGAFVGASYLTGGSSASSFLTTFSSAYGNAKSNAYQNGANDKTATETAIVSGLAEAISEQFFDKIPGMKTQGWGEKLVGKVGSKAEKYFGTKTGKVVMNILDNSGEGFEEIISDILNTTGNNIVRSIDKDYNGNLSLQTDTWLESFVYASITSALVNGGNTVLTNTQKNQILKAYAEENNMTLSQAKSVLNQETQLRADNIETNDLKERTNVEKEKQKQVLNEMKQNTYTADERISIPQEVQQEVKEEVQEEVQEQQNVQPTISIKKVNKILQDTIKNSTIEYTSSEIADLRKTIYDEFKKLGVEVQESKNFIESAKQNNFNADSEEIKSVARMMEARELNAKFDSTPFKNNNEAALWTIDENGKRSVVFNPNASEQTIFQNVAVHELTHDLLSSENSKETLKPSELIEYISKTPGYDVARQSLEDSYAQVYDRNSEKFKELVDEEVIASVLGNKLGSQEFINRLNGEKPNIARRIYNWVIDKLDNIGKSSEYKAEKKYWKEVANRFEKAFNMEQKNSTQKSDTRYSIHSTKSGLKYVIDNKLKQDSNMTLKEVFNSIKNTEYLFEDGDTAYIVGWLKSNSKSINNKSMYNELFSRYPSVFKNIDDIKDFNKLVNYNTDELLKTSVKTQKNIADINNKHKYWNIESFDTRESVLYDDTNDKAYIIDFSIANLKDGKKIAYAKKMAKASNDILNKIKTSSRSLDSPIAGTANNISQSNKNVKSDISTKYSIQENQNNASQELDNSFFSLKENNNLRDKAKQELGTTNNLNEAGYLTTDGEYLDFSGKKQGARGGQRQMDHREIADIYSDEDYETAEKKYSNMGSNTAVMQDFIDRGNIRLNGTGVEIASAPTSEQYNKLYDYLEHVQKDNGEVFIDLDTETKNRTNLEYDSKTYVSKMINDIKEHYNFKDNSKSVVTDNQGKTLSKEQQEYFKDSKVRDEEGKLIPVYHGTTEEINVFDKNRLGNNTGAASASEGFFFTDNKRIAEEYSRYARPQYIKDLENEYKRLEKEAQKTGNWDDYYKAYEKYEDAELTYAYNEDNQRTNAENQKEVYLNLTNPLIHDFKGESYRDESYYDLLKQAKENGNDGAMFLNTYDGYGEPGSWDNPMTNIYVAFDSNQIKNIDNTKPTSNDDIRYSKENNKWDAFVNKNFKTKGKITTFGELKNKNNNIPISKTFEKEESNKKIETKENNIKQEKNIPKEKNTIEERIEKNEQTLKISQMSDNKLKETSKTIAEQINKDGGLTLKQRKWISTSTESEILDNAISIEDLDPNKIYYTPIGNKTTLDKANKNLNKLGYEDSIKYIQNKLSTGERISASDVALSERLIQEAVKKGDIKTAQELIMDTAILGTEYGQTIQALSIIQKLTPEGQLKMLDKIVMREKSKGNKTFEGVEITPEMVEKILKAYSKDGTYNQDDLNRRVEEVKQEIADQLKTTVGEKIDAWRYLSMLGNPKTHIRNIVSNVAMKGAIKYKNALARTMETIIPIKNRTKTWKKSSEVVKDFAKQKATELRDVISGETKYSEKTSIESKKQIFKTKFLDKLYNTNSALLDVEDWLFSKSAFESTFREYLTAHDIKTQQDIDNNPTIVEKAQNYAIEQAQIATFRQYSKIASQINKFERNNKMGGFLTKAVVPFKKTPINIAKAGVNYSPLGLIKNLSYDIIQVKKGNIEASQYIDNLSQGLSGSSIALLGYVLAKAGILKGDDDKDKESKYDSALGNKAYSIKIGNDYYSLSWLSPVGMPLFVGANAYKELEENKNIDMNVVSDMLVSTLNPISEMSLVSGLTDTLTSYEGESSKIMGEIAKSSLKSYVGQFFPTLLSQIASVTDSEKRSTTPSSNSKWKYGEEVLNSIKYKIPFARQTLSTYTDLWGNTQKQADNIVMRAWETFIAPYSRYDNKKKKLDEEIQEVYYKTGNIDVIPGTPNSSITLNKEKYRLSNKEYLQFKKTYGTTANNYIEAIIKNSDYKKATYEDKAKIIDRVYDYALTNAQTEYFKKQKIDMSNYGHKSISNKLDMFKEENYSYDDIADYIIYNYYKYKRD